MKAPAHFAVCTHQDNVTMYLCNIWKGSKLFSLACVHFTVRHLNIWRFRDHVILSFKKNLSTVAVFWDIE